MRAIIQRVSSASVSVDRQIISQISKGLMVLIGIGTDDTMTDANIIINKILNVRLFSDPKDESKSWKSSVKDLNGEILCVSQFTLFANTTKGNKPDFHRAMPAEPSKELYNAFLKKLSESYDPQKIRDGRFGAMMSVSICNEGPVTITIDSRKFEYVEKGYLKSPKGTPQKGTNSGSESPAANV
ncbi:D-tyrosyl-tRNA deacylase [Fistulina hepatica ATCC 64428]|nr:D-tyrosyl-tRNA deacylase [Fistulina hepatica ATCC 64428]